MNKKLFSTLFIIVILASFSAIGCKNPNTDPTPTGTDIGEKYAGTWYLNATMKVEFGNPAPQNADQIIAEFDPQLDGTAVKNDQIIINDDGSIKDSAGDIIQKTDIVKQGDKYIVKLKNDYPNLPQDIFPEAGMEITFNADGTGTVATYLVMNLNNNYYNFYLFKDGKLTKNPVQ